MLIVDSVLHQYLPIVFHHHPVCTYRKFLWINCGLCFDRECGIYQS